METPAAPSTSRSSSSSFRLQVSVQHSEEVDDETPFHCYEDPYAYESERQLEKVEEISDSEDAETPCPL